MIKNAVFLVLKGIAIGTANVIPGVSGGTLALITGVFERLINAIKSFNLKAIKLIANGKLREFAVYTDLSFLLLIITGMVIAIFSAARLFDYLFTNYPVYIWSFFFGLILASVWFVFRTIEKWDLSVIITGIVGVIIAAGVTFLTPAQENDNIFYLMVCGAVAICSMILPGLSGSFVLMIMGNYKLVAIDAINELRLEILVPFAIGAGIGLLAFSHLLAWVFKHFRNQTLALLTGFIAGSLGVIWPWKESVVSYFGDKEQVTGYTWNLPQMNMEFVVALALMAAGVAIIFLMEGKAAPKTET